MKKKRKLKPKVILFLILFLIFLISTLKIGLFYKDANQNKLINEEIKKEVVNTQIIINDEGKEEEQTTIDFSILLQTNENVKGWIRTNDNKINYPIVQGNDNEYYLTHAINKKSNTLGSIFMDYRNNDFTDQNVIIYGHNASDKSMFGYLREIFDKGYFDTPEHNLIEIIDLDNNTHTYKIFSYYIIAAEEYYITPNFSTEQSYQEFLKILKDRSYHNFNVDLNSTDRILTLSTCNSSGPNSKRTVIHAKLIS